MIALFSQGFRPFFLMAGVVAPIGVLFWVLSLMGVALPDGPLPLLRWHTHELLAGFIGAAMIGFLLTAIPNWTGGKGYSGRPLMAIAAVFLLARLLLLPGSPVGAGLALGIALLPLPATMLMVLPALIRAGSARLFGPPALVMGFWLGQLLMVAEETPWWSVPSWAAGQLLMANTALLLVGLIGGRIVPAFTLNALRRSGRPAELSPLPGLDRGAMLALFALVAVDVVAPGSTVAGFVALLAGLLLALRLSRWHGLKTLSEPLLWVMHLAYALAPAALVLKAIALLTDSSWALAWLHLQLAGAVALMVMAVMTRAALGHTGRELRASRGAVMAYGALALAALLRVFTPAVLDNPLPGYVCAACFWVLAFACFLGAYWRILIMPNCIEKTG